MAEAPEATDRVLISKMLDDGLWAVGLGTAAGLIVGAVVLPRGAGGARALFAGLGGGFGAGRVFERYNSELVKVQGGAAASWKRSFGDGFDDMVRSASGALDQARTALGMGKPSAEAPTVSKDAEEGAKDETGGRA